MIIFVVSNKTGLPLSVSANSVKGVLRLNTYRNFTIGKADSITQGTQYSDVLRGSFSPITLDVLLSVLPFYVKGNTIA